MSSIRTSVLLTLAVLVSSFVANSQEPQDPYKTLRARTFGEVRDLAGKPWVSVKVMLVSQPIPMLDGSDSADVVEAVTDERGKFRAAVLRHRLYSAWAMAKADNDTHRVTNIEENVAVGVWSKLQEVKSRAFRTTLNIRNLDEWPDRMPVRIQVLNEAKNKRRVPVKLDADNKVTLPPMPGRSCTVEVFGKNGGILFSDSVSFPRTNRPRRLSLGKKREYLVAVRDGRTGKGVPRATIYWSVRGHFHPIGKSDKDGVAKVELSELPAPQMMFASAKGFAISQVRTGKMRLTKANGWKPLREKVTIVAHTNMSAGVRVTGEIRIGGKPAKNVVLFQRGQSLFWDHQAVHYIGYFQRVIRTDAAGRFAVDASSSKRFGAMSIDAILTSANILQLPKSWHRQVTARVHDVVELTDAIADSKHELEPIDLTRFCPVMLEVAEHTGLPASKVEVSLGSTAWMNSYYMPGSEAETDRSGRLCMLVRPTEEMILALSKEGSIFAKRLHVRSGLDDYSLAFLRVKLKKPWSISGKAISKKGKPVAKMPLYCYMSWQATPQVDEEVGCAKIRGVGNGAAFGDLGPTEFRSSIGRLLNRAKPTITNKKGEFRIVVPPIPMKWQIYGSKSFFFVSQSVNATVEVEGGPVKDQELTIR